MDINKLVRYIAYTLEIYLLFLLQQTPGLFPEIYGARPVLLFPAAVAVSLIEREIPAMAFGIIAGLLVDFGFGAGLGFHSLLMAVVCFFVSVLTHTILRVNLGTAIVMSVWMIAVFVLGGWIYQYLWNGYSYAGYAILRHYLPKYLYTLLMFPLIFLLNRGIAKTIHSEE